VNTQRNPIKSFCKERQHIFFSERYVLLCSKALHNNKQKGFSMRILSMLSKVNFYIGGTTCDILINKLSTRGPLKLPCVIGLALVIDVMGCHEIPGKSW
jgi:hypothetical protein